jgi:hypothetical protein
LSAECRGVDDDEMVLTDDERYRDRGPANVGEDHDAPAGQPVDDGTGEKAEEQHRHDLERDGHGDVHPGPGELEDEDDEGDGVERVPPAAHRLGQEETTEAGRRQGPADRRGHPSRSGSRRATDNRSAGGGAKRGASLPSNVTAIDRRR